MPEAPHPKQPEPFRDSSALLQQVKGGDQRALQSLLATHLGPLRAFVRLQSTPLLRTRETESDIVQHVCVEVLQRVENFTFVSESKFRGWLYGAVLNVVRDRDRYHKADRRSPTREEDISNPDALLTSYRSIRSPSSHLLAAEETRQLEEAFERLPPHYAQVLALAKVAQLSRTDMAEQLGISPEAVSKLQKRAILRLSKELKK